MCYIIKTNVHSFVIGFPLCKHSSLLISASMGESEGKAIGQWFGPNTVAQVLKYVGNILITQHCKQDLL